MKRFKLLLIVFNIFLSSSTALAQLSGTYTIGGSKPDYKTITEAINDVNKKGINGPVILKIHTGVYYENVNLINQPSFSATNTLTLESETGDSTDVLITGNSDSLDKFYIVYLSSPYITVSSLSISCDTNYFAYFSILNVYSTSSEGVKHCYIYAPAGSGNTLAEFGADSNGRVILDNNRFEGANNKVLAGNYYGNTIIKNNRFNNTSDFGLEVGFTGGIEIYANEFVSGVKLNGGNSNLNSTIQKNIFHSELNAGNTILNDNIVYGNASFSMDNIVTGNKFINDCSIDGNNIICSKNEFSFVSCFGNISVLFLSNKIAKSLNMFADNSSIIIGNYLFGSIIIDEDNVWFANNFIKRGNESDYFYLNSQNPVVISNNFLGYKDLSINHYATIINNNFSCDDIYTNKGEVRNNNYFPFGGKNDSHPYNIDPMYLNDTDLHATNPLLSGKGEYILNNDYDIDSFIRDQFPTIGANEICIDQNTAKTGVTVSCGDSICLHLCNSVLSGNFTWFPDSGLDNIHKNSPLASPHKTTLYHVIETYSGYKDSVLVIVKPFQVNTIQDTTLLCGDSIILYVSKNPNAINNWYPDTFLTTYKTNYLIAKPNESLKYFVSADIPGCSSSIDSVYITIKQFQIKTINDTTLNCGGYVYFQTNYPHYIGAVEYSWYPSYGLSDSTGLPAASPGRTTTYIVRAEIPQCATSYDTVTITVDSIPFVSMYYYQIPFNDTIKFSCYSTCADSVLWDFGDSTYSNLYSPDHLYKKSGQYHVRITAYNSYWKNHADTIIWVNNSNSIFIEHETLAVNIFPNPTNNIFYLKFNDLQVKQDISVSIFNLLGKSLFQKQFKISGYANEIYSFDLSNQIPGMYLIEIKSGNQKLYKKILKN